MSALYENENISFILANKHKPRTTFPNWHPMQVAAIAERLPRGATRVRRMMGRYASRIGMSNFDDCSLIVQCGTPVMWHKCHRAEWVDPIWHQTIGRLSNRIPVLNLAAGSSYPWEGRPYRNMSENDYRFLETILSYCRLTTVRDSAAQQICASMSYDVPMIPCSAFLATEEWQVDVGHSSATEGPVLINYMQGGGHFDFGQGINADAWEQTVTKLIERLGRRHELALLCHNETEYQLAQQLAPKLPRRWPKTPQEYFHVVSDAKAAVCNRMHASVALAGLGIPSVAVGTDTRLKMVEALGLPCFYVKDAGVDELEGQLESLLKQGDHEEERLMLLRSQTWKEYIDVVADALLSK